MLKHFKKYLFLSFFSLYFVQINSVDLIIKNILGTTRFDDISMDEKIRVIKEKNSKFFGIPIEAQKLVYKTPMYKFTKISHPESFSPTNVYEIITKEIPSTGILPIKEYWKKEMTGTSESKTIVLDDDSKSLEDYAIVQNLYDDPYGKNAAIFLYLLRKFSAETKEENKGGAQVSAKATEHAKIMEEQKAQKGVAQEKAKKKKKKKKVKKKV